MYLHDPVFLPVDWHSSKEKQKMRRLALAIALACVLSGAARAGEMPSTGLIAPPPPPPTAPGEMPGTGLTVLGASEEPDTVLTIILTFISIVR